ncbi:amidoligase family protein [Salinicola sp. RZ23]|uniref:amidoligase family protein n=1 Tax=Salinicola sp. RZ23 TaxID=1949087 RepID=UPI000DA225B8|nr:amidoligase family protein [Salinicola sp. RZ23]
MPSNHRHDHSPVAAPPRTGKESDVPLTTPPQPDNRYGRARCVGVEIEFAGIAPLAAARLVEATFGGTLKHDSAHRLRVADTPWGTFHIELDSQYVHPDAALLARAQSDNGQPPGIGEHLRASLHSRTREWLGDMVAGLVPTEIVCPPLPWHALAELDALFDALRSHGAEGTDASLIYAFGLHLNPEIPAPEVESVLAHLRAYLILAEWLRDQIVVDLTRDMLPHTRPFSETYASLVLDPDYQPTLPQLIDDYLEANPTRNRELDLLPLFAWLAPDHPSPLLQEGLVKPRPTYHYRLPNASLSDPDWGASLEWNRWVEVERLAADPARLAERCAAYREHLAQPTLSRWLDSLQRWMRS